MIFRNAVQKVRVNEKAISNDRNESKNFDRKVHGNSIELFFVRCVSIVNVIMRLIIFSLLSPFKRVYSLKMSAYVYTLSRIFTATKGL